jgi:hypothetical protein
MIHSNRISTDTIVKHDTGRTDRLCDVFGSGNSLSREAFDALWRPTDPSGVDFFKLLMRTAVEFEAVRASLLSTMSRSAAPAPSALRHHWLQAHALGHLALLSFRDDVGWFAAMLSEVTVNRWTPTLALVRERIMSVALRGAWAAGQLGEAALGLYLPVLRSPVEPLQHFDAVLAIAMVCVKHPHLAPLARTSLEQWASRANAGGQFRKELMDSVAFLLDDPDGARIWSTCWCRRVLSLHGARDEQSLVAEAAPPGTSEFELLLLAALNDVSDCGIFLGGLSPAVMLLSHLQHRNPDEFYAPASVVPILAQTWTPELSLDVLSRSVPATAQRKAFDA